MYRRLIGDSLARDADAETQASDNEQWMRPFCLTDQWNVNYLNFPV